MDAFRVLEEKYTKAKKDTSDRCYRQEISIQRVHEPARTLSRKAIYSSSDLH